MHFSKILFNRLPIIQKPPKLMTGAQIVYQKLLEKIIPLLWKLYARMVLRHLFGRLYGHSLMKQDSTPGFHLLVPMNYIR